MTDKYELSRRKALAGLATIGAAGAGAGLGTSAFFSDQESFENNVLTAGELDLAVGYYSEWDQGMAGSGSVEGAVDGTTVESSLTDMKPGDSGLVAFCFEIDDNPAYMWACGELTANNGNGLTEPESAVDDSDGNGEGELAQAIEATVSYCDVTRNESGAITGVTSQGDELVSGSLAEVLATLQTGVPLDGNGDGGAVAGSQDPFAGTGQDDSDATNPCVCIDWELPTSVGNAIQGDSLAFSMEFYAQQARHNDGTTNPCIDESYTADYENPSGIAQPIPGGVLNLDVSYGDQRVAYAIEFDESAASTSYHLYDPNFANANFSMPFDADEDGIYDFQVAWNAQDNDEFLYSGVNSNPNWDKDTSAGWSALPAGITATKSGNQAIITVPRSILDAGANTYLFGFLASAGGEQPSVSIPDQGPYSSDNNFTSSQNGQQTTLL
ncbi:SipW-dependent-type signal peptide-containing protein [Halobacteriales archaeon Cl-PHB]